MGMLASEPLLDKQVNLYLLPLDLIDGLIILEYLEVDIDICRYYIKVMLVDDAV